MTGPYETKAYAYHANGWAPLPLPAHRKTPPPDDYTGNNGLWPSGADIAEWIQDHPDSNIGLRLPRNIIGIDVDHYADKPGGLTLAALENKLGPLPATWTSSSRTDGISGIRFYRVPTGLRWPGILGPGIELIRYGHRYAVAAPSVHPEGGTYTWTPPNGGNCNGTIPAVNDLPDLPTAWTAHFTGGELETIDPQADLADSAAREWIQTRGTGNPCGIMTHITHKWIDRLTSGEARHDSAMKGVLAIVRMAGAGHQGGSAALGQLRSAFLASVNGDPDRDEKAEFQRMIPGAVRRVHIDHPEPVTIDPCLNPFNELISTSTPLQATSNGTATQTTTMIQVATEIHSGQLRMAKRLATTHHNKLLHVHGIGWHHYDGTRWIEDDTRQAGLAVWTTIRDAILESANGDKKLRADATRCESAAGIKGTLEAAACLPEFAATVRDLDADPYILNVANGTLDLHTLQIKPHDPTDRLTKVCNAAYNPDATSTLWAGFLERVLPDEAVRAYLQRYVGSGLSGRVLEHALAILTGEGRNGKGVFYGAVRAALGDYAATADPDLFMHREGAHPTGEMDLRGLRWVVVSESDKHRKLAEATVKRLTGGDEIKARRMRQDFVAFDPSHTAALVTNHLPKVSGDDPALWARLRVIPFDVVIPEEERDVHLGERLSLEVDAVLTWLVAGLRAYQERGRLDEPAAVLRATDKYRIDSDAIAGFLEARCIINPHMRVTVADLWAAWTGFCSEAGADETNQKAFGEALDRRGFAARKGAGGIRLRSGLGLLSEDEDEE